MSSEKSVRAVVLTPNGKHSIAYLGDDEVIDEALRLVESFARTGRPLPARPSFLPAEVQVLCNDRLLIYVVVEPDAVLVRHAVRLDE